jgi:hypothetical protein
MISTEFSFWFVVLLAEETGAECFQFENRCLMVSLNELVRRFSRGASPLSAKSQKDGGVTTLSQLKIPKKCTLGAAHPGPSGNISIPEGILMHKMHN